MTVEEAKIWLKSYRYLIKEAERIEEELQYWQSKSQKITRELSAQSFGGANQNQVSNSVEKIIELEETLKQKHTDLIKRKTEIEKTIDALQNETYRLILKLKYINGDKWESIAVKMNYNYRWTLYLHGRALQALCNNTA